MYESQLLATLKNLIAQEVTAHGLDINNVASNFEKKKCLDFI